MHPATKYLDLDATGRIQEIHRKYGNPLLARGAFGEISIAIDVRNGWRLAVVKTMSTATVSTGGPWDQNSKRLLSPEVFNEVMALRLLSPHPNVVPFLGLFLSEADAIPGGISLAFDYSPLDLHMLLEKRNSIISMSVLKAISRDIITALHHCHSHGILHRDVKPGNLLISRRGRILLCDFGLAKPIPTLVSTGGNRDLPAVNSAASGTKGLCTLWYRSPENLLGGKADHPAIDMYSAGLVIAEVLTGRVLFPGEGVLGQLGLIFSVLGTPTATHWPDANRLPDYGKVTFHPREPQSLVLSMPRLAEDVSLHDFMSALVCLDPEKRLTASRALKHSWFQSSMPRAASFEAVVQETVPRNLRGPSVLFSLPEVNDTTLTVARDEGLKIAAERRSYFKPEEIREMSIFEACSALNAISN
jgi:serine/threonine protein kinase